MIDKICIICKKEFNTRYSYQQICSRECTLEYHRGKQKARMLDINKKLDKYNKDKIWKLRNKEHRKEYSNSYYHDNKDYYAIRKIQWAKINPVKARAHRLVNEKIQKRLINPPTKYQCIRCEDIARDYHHIDYSKPFLLIPLCRSCHLSHHNYLKELRSEEK